MAAFEAFSATPKPAKNRSGRHPSGAGGPFLELLGPTTMADILAEILDAAERSDPRTVSQGLDRAVVIMGLAGSIDEVLLPVLRQIARWRMAGRCDTGQERMATEAARGWLDGRSAFAPTPGQPDPILLACGPRDQHTVDSEALAVLLRFQGWPCRVLGARTSMFDLTTATRATDPAAVVVLSHLDADRPYAVTAIKAVHRLGYRTYYTGDAFAQQSARESVAGEYLGVSMRDACARLAAMPPGS